MENKKLPVQYTAQGGQFGIACGEIQLQGLHPVVNGVHYAQAPYMQETDDSGRSLITFRLDLAGQPDFIVMLQPCEQGLRLQYRLENTSALDALDSFGVCFEKVQGVEKFFANGCHSWDASLFTPVEDCKKESPVRSYAMTQLLGRDARDILMLGFDRHDCFQQSFYHDRDQDAYRIVTETCWDRKPVEDGVCRAESLYIWRAEAVETGLRDWAQLIAENARTTPRLQSERITGWCSWYNYYAMISEEIILENLAAARRIAEEYQLNIKIFLVDDGFTSEMGDWLETKPQFPNGMQPILSKIREAGFVPGLWIAPFLVGNRSQLFQKHPDWLVVDKQTGKPYICMRFYGEFRWHKRSEEYYLLDITHPQAAAWLETVIRTWCGEWGAAYVKADFLHMAMDHGPERLQFYEAGLTRVEYWRKGITLIRNAAGAGTVLAGCGVPLWAGVGLFESVRIGNDMGVEWLERDNYRSPLSAIPHRNFLHNILYQADPDCVLLRPEFHHLTDPEIDGLVTLAGLTGGVLMTSDTMDEIPPDRLKRLQRLVALDKSPCDFPLLGRGNPSLIVQVRKHSQTGRLAHVFVMNLAAEPVAIHLQASDLGVETIPEIYFAETGEAAPLENDALQIQLEGHAGVWFVADPDFIPLSV